MTFWPLFDSNKSQLNIETDGQLASQVGDNMDTNEQL